MAIYLVVFGLSTLCIYLAKTTKNKSIQKLLIIIGLLLPAILAGLRAENIGVDVKSYAISFFERAKQSDSIINFLKNQSILGNADIGFNLIVYLVAKVVNDYHWSLFVYELVAVTVVYIAFCRCEKLYGTPVWLVMLLYYFSMYNVSLNIMRQTIAVSFVTLAVTYLFDKQYKPYFVLMVIAFAMHSSAILGFGIFPMYLFLQDKPGTSEKKQFLKGMFAVAVVGAISVTINNLVRLLVNMGIFRENYLNYLSGGQFSTVSEGRSISLIVALIQATYLLILVVHFRYLNRRKMQGLFYIFASGVVFMFTVLGPLFAEYISRSSYFFIPLQMIGLSNTYTCYSEKSKNIWAWILIAILFATWYRAYVLLNYAATVPYQFYWD